MFKMNKIDFSKKLVLPQTKRKLQKTLCLTLVLTLVVGLVLKITGTTSEAATLSDKVVNVLVTNMSEEASEQLVTTISEKSETLNTKTVSEDEIRVICEDIVDEKLKGLKVSNLSDSDIDRVADSCKESLKKELVKYINNNIPVKGKDYFTEDEINSICEKASKKATTDIEPTLKDIKDSIDVIKKDISNINNDVKDLKDVDKTNEDKIVALTNSTNESVKEINDELSMLKNKVDITKKHSSLYKATTIFRDQDTDEVKYEVVDTSNMTIAEYVDILAGNDAEYTKAINKINKYITSLEEKDSDLQDQIDYLENTLTGEEQDRAQAIKDLNYSLKDTNDQMTENLKNLKAALESGDEATITTARDELQSSVNTINETIADNKTLLKKEIGDSAKTLQNNVDTVQSNLDDTNANIADLEKTVSDLSKSTKQVTDHLQNEIDELDSKLNSEISARAQAIKDLNDSLKDTNDKIVILNNELGVLSTQVTTDITRIDGILDKLAKADETNNAQLRKDLKDAIDKANTDVLASVSANYLTKEEGKAITDDIKNIKDQLKNDKTDITNLQSSVNSLKEDLKKTNAKIEGSIVAEQAALEATAKNDVTGSTIFAKIGFIWKDLTAYKVSNNGVITGIQDSIKDLYNKITGVYSYLDETDTWWDGSETISGYTKTINGSNYGLNIKPNSDIQVSYATGSIPKNIRVEYTQGDGYFTITIPQEYRAEYDKTSKLVIESIHVTTHVAH